MMPHYIKNLYLFILFFPLICVADSYSYGNKHFEVCLSEVMKIKPGIVIKVEMKREDNMLVYEFDIRDEDNRDWDVECNADTAKIIEIEEEAFGVQHEQFRKYMKIDLQEAKSIALKEYPGEIIEVEYELEQDGTAVYEFDISTDEGKEIKIEIDAASGDIHEVAVEIWQIGYE